MEVNVSSPERYVPGGDTEGYGPEADSDAERKEGPSGPKEEAPSQGGIKSVRKGESTRVQSEKFPPKIPILVVLGSCNGSSGRSRRSLKKLNLLDGRR